MHNRALQGIRAKRSSKHSKVLQRTVIIHDGRGAEGAVPGFEGASGINGGGEVLERGSYSWGN